ncbi:MAG: dimethylmenaquinone methyltransferase, partial [Bryobacteraceae bacterium]
MIRNRDFGYMALALSAWALPILAPAPAHAQLWTWTREQMIEYTPTWAGDRFADGRPKVSDGLLDRARGLSSEELVINWADGAAPAGKGGAAEGAGGGRGNPYGQYTGGWQVLHPSKKMVGRAVTMAFMPARPDLDAVVNDKARAKGIDHLRNQTVIDMLQPGDVLVVDIYGKQEGGTIVGDNLFHYIMRATKGGGLVVDGSIRDLEGISEIDMPAYFRSVHPSYINGVTVAAVNVPIRIGDVTVMPGDVVIGDPEGVSFVPPQLIEGIVDRADTTHIHDEWTKK